MVSYKLDLPRTMEVHNVFHSSLLKPWVRRPGEPLHPSPIIVDGEVEWEVECLVDKREKEFAAKKGTKHHPEKTRRKRVEYLIKWKGFDAAHNEWKTEAELRRCCNKLVDAYDNRVLPLHPPKRRKRR